MDKRSADPPVAPPDAAIARQRALSALKSLAEHKPLAEVNYGEIGAEAGLPWQTVKRLLGPRDSLAELLSGNAPEPVDTRERILESAARVFARKGYLSASLDEVAGDSGLTKGAVYWHFKSKNDLFFALLDSRFQGAAQYDVNEALAQDATHQQPREALKHMLRGILDHIREDPDWPRLVLEFMGQAREPGVRARLGAAYLDSYSLSADLIARQHGARGLSPAADPELLAIFWSALMDGLVMAWLLNPERIDLDDLVPSIVDLLWRGLAPRHEPT